MTLENSIINSILVKNFEGKEIDLMDVYAGKNLLIIIYNNQCLGCTGRAISLAYQFQKDYHKLQVIGIHTIFNSLQVTENDIKSIFTIDELPFPILLDEGHKVFDQFHAAGTPQWLLIDEHGRLIRSIFGSQYGSRNLLMYALDQMEVI